MVVVSAVRDVKCVLPALRVLRCVPRVQVVHGLGRLPEYVSVTVRVPASGPNAGFLFEAVGMTASSGNTSRGAYGGVVFGYNETGGLVVEGTLINDTAVASREGRAVCVCGGGVWMCSHVWLPTAVVRPHHAPQSSCGG